MTQQMIGFVGLGNMGTPMALNLLKAGDYELIVYDLEERRIAPFTALGASQAFRLRDVGAQGGIVVTMVPTDGSLLDVALGEGGLMESLCPGGIHLSLSTISPEVAAELATLYAERGGTFLAGTVLGRPDVAERAALSIYLSGPAAPKGRVLPLLRLLGSHVYDLGENVTSANVVKLGANFLILGALVAMGEAAALVDGYGLDRALFLRSMAESPLFSGAVYEGYGQMIGAQCYADANFPVAMGLKDARLILDAAERIGLPMPLARLACQHLLAAQASGREGESWAVLAEFASAFSAQVPVGT
jgi:3-hydroxyisobutyrate dehydrogenase-like beta-hydroxyacid dehydrogenase